MWKQSGNRNIRWFDACMHIEMARGQKRHSSRSKPLALTSMHLIVMYYHWVSFWQKTIVDFPHVYPLELKTFWAIRSWWLYYLDLLHFLSHENWPRTRCSGWRNDFWCAFDKFSLMPNMPFQSPPMHIGLATWKYQINKDVMWRIWSGARKFGWWYLLLVAWHHSPIPLNGFALEFELRVICTLVWWYLILEVPLAIVMSADPT